MFEAERASLQEELRHLRCEHEALVRAADVQRIVGSNAMDLLVELGAHNHRLRRCLMHVLAFNLPATLVQTFSERIQCDVRTAQRGRPLQIEHSCAWCARIPDCGRPSASGRGRLSGALRDHRRPSILHIQKPASSQGHRTRQALLGGTTVRARVCPCVLTWVRHELTEQRCGHYCRTKHCATRSTSIARRFVPGRPTRPFASVRCDRVCCVVCRDARHGA